MFKETHSAIDLLEKAAWIISQDLQYLEDGWVDIAKSSPKLTTTILHYNKVHGIPNVPHVHKYGVRRDNKTKRDIYGNITVQHKVDHKWEQWREEERDRKLHLTDAMRMVLGRAVNKYFRFNT